MNLSDIINYKNGIPNYDLNNTVQFLEYRGKKLFGNHFKIHVVDYEIILQMVAWIINDQETCKKYNISRNKGIILSGQVGCGKTSIMKLFATLTPLSRAYRVKPARDVTMEFSKHGYDVINGYSRSVRSPKPICFDDIGVEPPMRYFGDQINVMGEIFLTRYELFISKGIQTHATTNLTAEELENRYGTRVRSRLREMVNLIAFSEESIDKRI